MCFALQPNKSLIKSIISILCLASLVSFCTRNYNNKENILYKQGLHGMGKILASFYFFQYGDRDRLFPSAFIHFIEKVSHSSSDVVSACSCSLYVVLH